MVNIQAVIAISNSTVIAYNCWDSFWTASLAGFGPRRRQRQETRMTSCKEAEKQFAVQYGLSLNLVEHVTTIFGTIREARIRMADEHYRSLLCNLDHRVVVQVWSRSEGTRVVSTVYRPYDYEIIEIINTVPEGIPDANDEEAREF